MGWLHSSTPEQKELAEALEEIALPAIDRQKQPQTSEPLPLSSAVFPPIQSGQPQAWLQTATTPQPRRSKKRSRSKVQMRRDGIFFGALQANLRGRAYCRHLDRFKIKPLEAWVSEGCPSRYEDAYKAGQDWKKKIQDQKHRFKRRYDKTSNAEREKLIQDATRSTRS